MLHKVLSSFVLVLLIAAAVPAQSAGNVVWENLFGGEAYDEANAVAFTNSGDFIVAGYTQSYGLGRWGNGFIFKVDANGDSIWTRNYGREGMDVFAGMTTSSDGKYVATGLTDTPDNWENIYMVKVDGDGNLIWEKNFGSTVKDVALGITNAQDGGLVMTGVTKSAGTGDEEDLFIFKTTVDGDSLWFKTYGTPTANDGGYGINTTSDGGYIITGLYDALDVWLVKTDANGDTLWTKTFSHGNYSEGKYVMETEDGGFIICGSGSSNAGDLDIYVIKTDSSGRMEWDKAYGFSGYDEGRKILKRDNGYLVVGSTDSGIAGEFDFYTAWVNKNGDTVLTKTYGDAGEEDRCFDAISAGNDFFMLAGTDFETASLSNAALLLIESGNGPSAVESGSVVTGYQLYNAYPNPFNPSTKINFNIPSGGFVSLNVYNTLGEEVATLINGYQNAGLHSVNFNADNLANGIYIYKLTAEDYSATKKMILLK